MDQSNTLCRGARAHLLAYLPQAAWGLVALQSGGTESEPEDPGYSEREDSELAMQR